MADIFSLKTSAGSTLFSVDDAGNLTMTGDVGAVDLTLSGNTVIGDAATDTVSINADLTTGLKWDAGTYTYLLDASAMTTGQADVIIGDNLAEALVVRESTNAYLTFVTTNSAEAVKIHKTILSDMFAVATVAAADATGGATTTTMTLQLRDLANASISTARRVMVVLSTEENGPVALDTSVTFSAATTGSLVSSGGGWAIVDTDATGAFGCTLTNATDETLYLRCVGAEVTTSTSKACVVLGSNSDAVAWSA
jgi:hypothetical protein